MEDLKTKQPLERTGERFRWALSTLCGTGELPPMGGTYASAVTVGLYALIRLAGRPTETIVLAILLGLCTGVGFWLVPWAEQHYGRRDPQPYVLDEVAGYCLSVLALPAALPLWAALAGSFLLFRFFDVMKPFPVDQLQKVPGAVGVVADDLMAGLYANILLQVIAAVAFKAV